MKNTQLTSLKSAATALFLLFAAPCGFSQPTLLFEGFEGDFPADGGWTVGDSDTSGTPALAFRDDVNAGFGLGGAHTGNWKGYCAGVGFGQSANGPTYADSMSSFMSRTIDLSGVTGATLDFWHNIPSIETCCDACSVRIDNTTVWSSSSPSQGWAEVTIPLTAFAGSAHTLTFQFTSDSSVVAEGWYLDDIRVTASQSPPNDAFADPMVLAGETGSVGGDLTGATPEAGEPPNHGRTVWHRWAPPQNGAYFFSTYGSAARAEIAVYTGNTLNDLTLLAKNDAFFAVTGTVYHIRVDGEAASPGPFTLQWGPVAAHLAEVRLSRLVYAPGSALTAVVSGIKPATPPAALRLIVAAGSNDVEVIPLQPTARPGVFETRGSLVVETALAPGLFTRGDGVVSLRPGEKFVAMFLPYDGPNRPGGPPAPDDLYFSEIVADFGVMEDPNFNAGSLPVRPEIAMTDDEVNVPPGGKRIGTLAAPGGLALQVPLDELVFYPRDASQMAQFLAETDGQVLMSDAPANSAQPPRAYLVRVNPNRADVAHTAQMRALLGEQDTLLASSSDTFKIYTMAMQMGLEGFVVGLNPRLQYMDAPGTRDGTPEAPLDAIKGRI